MTGETLPDVLPTRPKLDHVIIVVDDLDRAAAEFEKAGFTVAPKSFHPFGTANRLIVFNDNFIELLAVDDPEKLGTHVVVQEYLEANRGNGAWGLIWLSEHIERLHPALAKKGIEPSALQSQFTREVEVPGNRTETACFSSFALMDSVTPTYLEGFSYQHNPAALFVKEWQRHQNQARNISVVRLESTQLDDLHLRWKKMFGDAVRMENDRLVLDNQAARIEVAEVAFLRHPEMSGPIIREIVIEADELDNLSRITDLGDDLVDPKEHLIAAATEIGVSLLIRSTDLVSARS